MNLFGLAPYQRGMELFDDLEKRFFSGFPDLRNLGTFRTDILDKGDHYLLQSELPGFDKEQINIDVQGDDLIITATHEEQRDTKGENGEYVRNERVYGTYRRSFDLGNVDKEAIEASYRNGVLELKLPKAQSSEPQSRRIEIQ